MIWGTGCAVAWPVRIDMPAEPPFRGPFRMCAGCRERAAASVLLRVVAAEVGGVWSVVPDPRRRGQGRGASLHRSLRCLELAERRRAFTRALRRSENLDATPVREYLVAQGFVQ